MTKFSEIGMFKDERELLICTITESRTQSIIRIDMQELMCIINIYSAIKNGKKCRHTVYFANFVQGE